MIDTNILSKYLPYKLEFKFPNKDDVYYMYCLSIEGAIVLKNINDESDTHTIDESNVGQMVKPLLVKPSRLIKRYHKEFHSDKIDPEIFSQHYDIYDLIDQGLAIEKL
jgi:hypothetical protein